MAQLINEADNIDINEFLGQIRLEVGFSVKVGKIKELCKHPDVNVGVGKSGGLTIVNRATFVSKIPKIVEILVAERELGTQHSKLGQLRYNVIPRALAQVLLEENSDKLFDGVVDQINYNLRELRRDSTTSTVTADLQAFDKAELISYLEEFLAKEVERQEKMRRGVKSRFESQSQGTSVSSTTGGKAYTKRSALP